MHVTKDERIDLRLSSEHKDALMRAASALGLSLSDFVVSRSLEAANELLRKHTILTMSPRDLESFLTALDEDRKPNDALVKAAEQYKRDVRSGEIIR
jgi:uncharacterized protein (DUF1778 family)